MSACIIIHRHTLQFNNKVILGLLINLVQLFTRTHHSLGTSNSNILFLYFIQAYFHDFSYLGTNTQFSHSHLSSLCLSHAFSNVNTFFFNTHTFISLTLDAFKRSSNTFLSFYLSFSFTIPFSHIKISARCIGGRYAVWPDWAIFEKSWCQIFFQEIAQIYDCFSKNYRCYFGTTFWKNLGCFLFQDLFTL